MRKAADPASDVLRPCVTTCQHQLPTAGRSAAGACFETLWAAHARLVRGLCRLLLRDPQEAEDAAQQTFLSAYRSLVSGTRPENGGAWLATIAANGRVSATPLIAICR